MKKLKDKEHIQDTAMRVTVVALTTAGVTFLWALSIIQ